MNHTNNTHHETAYADNVIDLAARRRGLLERRGANPIELAVHLCAETGEPRYWAADFEDDGGWAA